MAKKVERFEGSMKKVQSAVKWFKDKIQDLSDRKVNKKISSVVDRNDQNIMPGKMVFYRYDPKYKDTLPFYDIYPLVIVVDIKKDGWTGLNLHYLPPKLRFMLFGRLLSTLNDDDMTKKSRFRITYSILNSMAKYKWHKPCFKRYLAQHVRSKIQVIKPEEWPKAIMMPTAKFKKSSQNAVWMNSKDMLR